MEIKNKTEWIGYGAALLAAILGSLGPPVFKKFIEDINMSVGIAYMLFLGGISTVLFYVFPRFRTGEKRTSINQGMVLIRLIFLGLFTVLAYLCYAMAMSTGSVTETVVIVRLSVLFSVFLSVVFLREEKIKSYFLVGMAIILCSSGLTMSQRKGFSFQEMNMTLVFYAISAAVFLAGSSVLQRYIAREDKMSSIPIVFTSMLIGGMLMASYSFIEGTKFVFPDAKQLSLLIFLGFGTIAIPVILSISAFKSIGVSKTSFFSYPMPILSGIAAFFLNEERGFSYVYLAIGFTLITLGVICTKFGITKMYRGGEKNDGH
jgi:drug/metabolite transporter (DMT)-like permease